MDYSIERVARSMTEQRERKGVSQAEAARGASVARQTLSNYETGATGLSFENAWRLANYYGCSLDDLGGRPWPPREG